MSKVPELVVLNAHSNIEKVNREAHNPDVLQDPVVVVEVEAGVVDAEIET